MIDLEIADGVAFITLNAPATRNALNNELASQFVAACDEADRDRRVGAWGRGPPATRPKRAGTRPSAASTVPSPGSASWRCRP
jgi:hypothetical protein